MFFYPFNIFWNIYNVQNKNLKLLIKIIQLLFKFLAQISSQKFFI